MQRLVSWLVVVFCYPEAITAVHTALIIIKDVIIQREGVHNRAPE